MAKNLINDETFEFEEGAEKTAVDQLAAAVNQLVSLNIGSRLNSLETISSEIMSVVNSQGDDILQLQGHANNSEIHVTEEEKEFISEPVIFGTYYGTGSSSRTINLEFTPKIVFVFEGDVLFTRVTETAGELHTFGYAAIAIDGQNSLGVVIGNESFTVIQGTGSVVTGYPQLNTSGAIYTYIALKKFPSDD